VGSIANVLEAPDDGTSMDQTRIREQIANHGEGRGGEGRKESKAIFFLQVSKFEFVGR